MAPRWYDPAMPSAKSTGSLGPRYRVLATLGEGAFGEVFRVEDQLLGLELALKRFKTESLPEDSLEILREEFLLLTRLHHPGIPKVHDVSVAGPAPYFTMEYLEGPDILRGLRGDDAGPLAPARVPAALAAFLAVLSALTLADL